MTVPRKCVGWLYFPVIFISTAAIYLPALRVGYLSDDYGFSTLFTISWSDLLRCIQMVHDGDLSLSPFRPVTMGSFWLDYQIWGWNPFGFHLTNILLHSINATLVWRFVKALRLPDVPALASALIYGFYPAHPEAVTWISGRFDLLSQTFFLASIVLWIEGRRQKKSLWMLSSSLFYLLSLFAKETIIAGIVIFPAVDWLFLRDLTKPGDRHNRGFRFEWLIAQVGMVLLLILTRLLLYGSFVGDAGWTRGTPFPGRTISGLLNALWIDLAILFTPVNRFLFDDWVIAVVTAFIMAGFIGGIYVSVMAAKKKEYAPLKLLILVSIWTLSLLAPTLPLGPVGDSLAGSRYLYSPALGLAAIAGLSFYYLPRVVDYRRWLPALLLCLWLAVAGSILWQHNRLWLDTGVIANRIDRVILDNTKDITDGTTLVVVNLPWLRKGVYFAPNGYNFYLECVYHRRHLELMYVQKDDSQIDQWWERLKDGNKPYIGFVWDTTKEILVPLP